MQEFSGQVGKIGGSPEGEQSSLRGKFEGENFARERQTASSCPIGQNAETKFSSTFLILLATIFFFT